MNELVEAGLPELCVELTQRFVGGVDDLLTRLEDCAKQQLLHRSKQVEIGDGEDCRQAGSAAGSQALPPWHDCEQRHADARYPRLFKTRQEVIDAANISLRQLDAKF